MNVIVLAYAGGPAVSATVPWLRQARRADVVTVTVDIGPSGDARGVRDRALAAGACRSHVLDRRDAFAREFLLPALQADATGAVLSADLVWPVVAQALVDVAGLEGATAVAHGCERDSLNEARLEAAIRTLRPDLEVIAIARARHGSAASPDRDEPGRRRARPGPDAPDEPASLDIAFAGGVPTAVNGVEMPLEELLSSLETIAGAFGVSESDDPDRGGAIRTTAHGMPALGVLRAAHLALRRQVVDEGFDGLCETVGRYYGELVTRGLWFTPGRRALDAFVAEVQQQMTGTVRLALRRGGGLDRVAATALRITDAGMAEWRPGALAADRQPVAL